LHLFEATLWFEQSSPSCVVGGADKAVFLCAISLASWNLPKLSFQKLQRRRLAGQLWSFYDLNQSAGSDETLGVLARRRVNGRRRISGV